MNVQCPYCKAEQQAPTEYENKEIKCSECGVVFVAEEISHIIEPIRDSSKHATIPSELTQNSFLFCGQYLHIFGVLIIIGCILGAVGSESAMPLLGVIGGLILCGLGTIANLLGRVIGAIQKTNTQKK